MRRLLSKPRRVLLRLLGVKRRRRYSNKNKYVAMLLKHDKKIISLENDNKELRKLLFKHVL
jgi:hypothetical protein